MNQGDQAPDFTAPDQTGAPVRLFDLLTEGPVVLFFYPKAFTPGCTKESCHFRDLVTEFAEAGTQRLGISRDGVARQAEFASQYGLDFPILSDPDRSIAKLYGVNRPGPLSNKRKTFVVGTDRRIIDVIGGEFNMDAHADAALGPC
ncbi:MAG: peroxiredoxin [Acidimicrobiia bacterium]|nr:peroxiredoxin [Acidimicrobiia bacterium]